MKFVITARSRSRETMGVNEIGLKSEHSDGLETLGTGVIIARFHWIGYAAELNERLNKWANGRAIA